MKKFREKAFASILIANTVLFAILFCCGAPLLGINSLILSISGIGYMTEIVRGNKTPASFLYLLVVCFFVVANIGISNVRANYLTAEHIEGWLGNITWGMSLLLAGVCVIAAVCFLKKNFERLVFYLASGVSLILLFVMFEFVSPEQTDMLVRLFGCLRWSMLLSVMFGLWCVGYEYYFIEEKIDKPTEDENGENPDNEGGNPPISPSF